MLLLDKNLVITDVLVLRDGERTESPLCISGVVFYEDSGNWF